MQDIIGKYTKAIVYADTVEKDALEQIRACCNSPWYEGLPIRIMPDCHYGKNSVIGFSCPIGKYLNPNVVGVDIGCTISVHKLSKPLVKEAYPLFEQRLKQKVPTGFDINNDAVIDDERLYKFLSSAYDAARAAAPNLVNDIGGAIDKEFIRRMLQRIGLNYSIWKDSLCSIGGGNHFLELDKVESVMEPDFDNALHLNVGDDVFLIHCGSRNFGLKVCNYWAHVAARQKPDKTAMQERIAEIKATVADKTQWESLIVSAYDELRRRIPDGFLSGSNLKGYLSDMVIVQTYAHLNHILIKEAAFDILSEIDGIKCEESVYTTHNYIDIASAHPMIRKGAISANKGETVVIPFNMAYGTCVAVGKGNPEWNYTAPHGAGRIMSRSEAKKNISLEDFKNSMKNVYSTSVCEGTIDESPMAYKNPEEIMRLIKPTVKVTARMKPVINIKATSEGTHWTGDMIKVSHFLQTVWGTIDIAHYFKIMNQLLAKEDWSNGVDFIAFNSNNHTMPIHSVSVGIEDEVAGWGETNLVLLSTKEFAAVIGRTTEHLKRKFPNQAESLTSIYDKMMAQLTAGNKTEDGKWIDNGFERFPRSVTGHARRVNRVVEQYIVQRIKDEQKLSHSNGNIPEE